MDQTLWRISDTVGLYVTVIGGIIALCWLLGRLLALAKWWQNRRPSKSL